ncbi:MAG: RecX family transcriptional regulator [Lachnospiraceae bacterium]|nr:RecX family transcriptional regulator [Lachnospiraceae bacterium]
MEIKSITDFKSNKVKIDAEGVTFALYKSDLKKYDIKEGELEEDIFNEIMTEILPKRALDRGLKIITDRDMTEGMIKDKLREDLYPLDIIDSVIERLKQERLINDERFIRGFIEGKSSKKSKRDIMVALSSKRVDMNLAERIYAELSEEGGLSDEKELIIKLLEKRHYDFENADFEDRQKQIRYLLGKGFSYDSIHSALKD